MDYPLGLFVRCEEYRSTNASPDVTHKNAWLYVPFTKQVAVYRADACDLVRSVSGAALKFPYLSAPAIRPYVKTAFSEAAPVSFLTVGSASLTAILNEHYCSGVHDDAIFFLASQNRSRALLSRGTVLEVRKDKTQFVVDHIGRAYWEFCLSDGRFYASFPLDIALFDRLGAYELDMDLSLGIWRVEGIAPTESAALAKLEPSTCLKLLERCYSKLQESRAIPGGLDENAFTSNEANFIEVRHAAFDAGEWTNTPKPFRKRFLVEIYFSRVLNESLAKRDRVYAYD